MSWFSDVTKSVSRAAKSVVHSPVTKGIASVGAVATGGLLAPVALGLQSAALADNVAQHGITKGLKRTASEQLVAKDPREVTKAAMKLLPKMVHDNVPLEMLVNTAVETLPGAKKALDANTALTKALNSGKPADIVRAAAAGVELEGGQKLEHVAGVQAAMNKLPKGARKAVASASNAVTKLHRAAQGRVKTDAVKKQVTGMVGLLIPLDGKGMKVKGRWKFGPGVRGFLLTSDGHVRVGSFSRA